MGFLALLLIVAAAGACYYFYQKTLNQRRHILLLSRQLDYLKSKLNKQSNNLTSVNIKFTDPPYKNGYTTENSIVYLSPMEDSPVVYKIGKPIKVVVSDSAEILNTKWYEIVISSLNGLRVKGWMREAEIKLVVDEASV